jgi:hypothetical protein
MSDPLAPKPFQLTAPQMDAVTASGTFTVIITSTGRPLSMARQLAAEDATQTMLRDRRAFILDLCGADCDIEPPG